MSYEQDYSERLEADIAEITKDGVVMLSDLTRLIERRLKDRGIRISLANGSTIEGALPVEKPLRGPSTSLLYVEQDDLPRHPKKWFCREHNTIFEEPENCDLCELQGFPAGEYEPWGLHIEAAQNEGHTPRPAG